MPCVSTTIENYDDEIRIAHYTASVNRTTGEITISTGEGEIITQRCLPGIADNPSMAIATVAALFCGEIACKAADDPEARELLGRLFRHLGAALQVEGFGLE